MQNTLIQNIAETEANEILKILKCFKISNKN